jgi:hypothetical protein
MANSKEPLKVDISFDEAMRRAVRVPPIPPKKKVRAKRKAKG